jgi:hypothetical protein
VEARRAAHLVDLCGGRGDELSVAPLAEILLRAPDSMSS